MKRVPKRILQLIERRERAQMLANNITMELDEYLEKQDIEFEYTNSHICLFTEPEMVANKLREVLEEETNGKE
jgi:hypothetical protein